MQFGAMLEHSAASAASSAATGPGETRRDASTQCELDVPTTVSVAVQCDIDCQPFTIQPVATSTPMDSQRTEYSVDADHDDDDDDNDNEYDDNDLTYEPSEISDITYDDFENTCEYVHDHDLSDLADTTTDDIPVEQQINFLVMESELKKLFKFCPQCGHKVISFQKSIVGAMISVSYCCTAGHVSSWRSQPMIRRMPAANILCSAAILLSGSTYCKISNFLKILHIPFVGPAEYYRIQNTYLHPVINEYWTLHQTAILSVLSDQKLRLIGDGRSDSPGFSAKYCSYTCMDVDSGLIVDQQLVQVTESGSSVAMERLALERSLNFLLDHGLQVSTLATDRHLSIQAFLRDTHPSIDHQFDVWHIAKSVAKKLTQKAAKKDAADLMPWVKSISNHLYWSAQTCNGDEQLLREKWMSCVNHVANVHSWNGEKMTSCEHGIIENDDTAWLDMDSAAHVALKDVVLNAKLVKDVGKLSASCHTGSLEVYHSMLLKYAPKRQHFHYTGMQSRLQLAALDHNHNVGRDLAKDKFGQPVLNQVFTKARKTWILRNVYTKKQYTYLDEILCKVVVRRGDKNVKMTQADSRLKCPVASSIATVPKPDKADAIANRKSRFK